MGMTQQEFQEYLLEKFTGKSAEYIQRNIEDAIFEYIQQNVEKVNVKEVLKGIGLADTKWDIEGYLKKNGITNAGNLVDKMKDGMDAISNLNTVYSGYNDFRDMVIALDSYNTNGNTQYLVDATSDMMTGLSEIMDCFGPIGNAIGQYFEIGSGLVEMAGTIVHDHYDQIDRIAEKLKEYASARNPQEAAKLLKEIEDLSTYKGYKEFVLKEKLIEEFEKQYGGLFKCFGNYESVLDNINSDSKYKEYRELMNSQMENIKDDFKNSLGSHTGDFDFDSVFNKDGTIRNVQSAIDYAGTLNQTDPLVFDLNGDGFSPVGTEIGAYFDLNGDGFRERVSWVRDDDALLAFDKNEDGIINNGNELFSNFSVLKNGKLANSGLEALKEYDDNGDGIIDENDMIFSKLRLWIDNGDGVSESWELRTLKELGITCIYLNNNSSDSETINGTVIKNKGNYGKADGTSGSYSEYWGNQNLTDSKDIINVEISDDIKILPNVRSMGTVLSLHKAMALDTTGRIKQLVKYLDYSNLKRSKLL